MPEPTTTPITIQIDEEALRAQIKRIISEETRVLAQALNNASWATSPEWRLEMEAERDKYLRAQWEAEQAAAA